MQRIGIISDTHLSQTGARGIPPRVFELFRGVDLILHGGDFTARRAWDELEAVAPVLGVRGNNDPAHLQLPRTRRVEVEGVVIGMAHGDKGRALREHPLGAFRGNNSTAANVLSLFEGEDDIGCFVFGHSHNPLIAWHRLEGREILLFNPGSPTDKRWGPHYGCGILTIDNGHFEPELFTW